MTGHSLAYIMKPYSHMIPLYLCLCPYGTIKNRRIFNEDIDITINGNPNHYQLITHQDYHVLCLPHHNKLWSKCGWFHIVLYILYQITGALFRNKRIPVCERWFMWYQAWSPNTKTFFWNGGPLASEVFGGIYYLVQP